MIKCHKGFGWPALPFLLLRGIFLDEYVSRNKQHDVTLFKPRPLHFFVASVIIIFLAEAAIMLFISFFDINNLFLLGIVDAALLSLIVVPTLYFMLFKPMRATISELDQSEKIQKQLEEIDQLKSEFISIAAHELCSPVSTIAGYTDLLLAGVPPEQQEKYLNIILSRTEALERIVDDLQVVNYLEAGENLQIVKAEHDIVETIRHVVKVYQLRIPDKLIQLDLPEKPLLMMFDDVRISQVLDNVISNAIKYENEVDDALELSVVDQGESVEIVVRDEGIGMTPGELKNIYKKFFRAQTEKALVGGLGLGMSIVKNIVDGHNGSIDIVSQRKVGTTVTITLPKNEVAQ